MRLKLVAALFALPALAWSQDQPQPKRVLILYGHDPHAPGVVAFTNELHAIVGGGSPPRVVFYDELLDLDRFPENASRAELVNYIVDKYRGFHFDAILTEGTRALKFATERVSAHFPNVPIVYGLAFEPEVDFSDLPKNVTGRRHLLRFAATLELARALQPDAERVVLVAGTGRTDSLLLASAVREMTPLVGGMQLVVWQNWTYASLLQSMRTLPPRTITILSGFSRDQSGQSFNEGDLIPSVTRSASGPVYGIARNWVGDGIVGGVTMDFGDDGVRTGRLLLQVLDRMSRGLPLPPSEVGRPEQVVDWRALERWGLSEDRLPPATEVLFRTPTVWERFRTPILAIAVILAAQSMLIALLLYERRARQRAEIESRRNLSLAADANRRETISALTGSISHELGQPLSAIVHNAQTLQMMVTANRAAPDATEEIANDIKLEAALAGQIIERHRTMLRSHDLQKKSIDLHEVIEESLALLAHDMRVRQVEATLELSSTPCVIDGDQVLLGQVLVNLIRNAVDALAEMPATRRHITIRSAVSAAQVEISVRDTGPGLPAGIADSLFTPFVTTKSHGLGIGLTIAERIVKAHGGTITVRENADGGVTFTVTLPRSAKPRSSRNGWARQVHEKTVSADGE